MEARTELVARPVDTGAHGRRATQTTSLRLLIRLSLVAIATVAAYQYSLATLLRDLATQSPIGYLALMPLLSIALAARTARQPISEPAIHDRYSDYIVGLPLLGGAVFMTMVLPAQLSLFYWMWRLDVLSLPLFVAGAIAISFGLRALWRYRLAVASLVLAWPLPHVWLIDRLPPSINTWVIIAVGASVVVAIGAVLLIARLRSRGWAVPRPGDHSLTVPHARIALVLVLLAGVAIALADSSMSRFELALFDTGHSRLAPFDARSAQLQRWSLKTRAGSPSSRLSGGAAVTWDRYTRPGQLPATGASQVSLDVFSSTDLRALAGYPLDVLYRFHGYELLDQRRVDLGGGLIAHVVVYADPTGATDWTAVYWDWPVQFAGRTAFQRVVLNQSTVVVADPRADPRSDAPATSRLIESARSIVSTEVGAGARP